MNLNKLKNINMRKNILTAILMLFALTAMAETKEIDNGYRWYLQAHINGSYSANEDMRYTSFGKGLGLGGDLGVGYNINDYWGLMLDLGYFNNKGAYREPDFGPWKNYSYKTFEPTINVAYNLTNAFLGFKPYRKNAVYLRAGVGAAFAFKNNAPEMCDDGKTPCPVTTGNQTVVKGNIGVDYVYMFNNMLAFTANATANLYGDKVNGCDWQVPVDARYGIGVGLRVYISKPKKASRETVVVDELKVYNDTIVKVEKVVVDDQDVYPVFFDVNATDLVAAQKDIVKTVAEKLNNAPSRIVYVLGYADKATEDGADGKLAKQRADAITAELVKMGIDPERIVTHDMGDNVQPFLNLTSKNRSTICIITDLKH